MPRFVVLHHIMPQTSGRPDHWDLMLETESSSEFDANATTLETWALETQPFSLRISKAKQLDDHRAWYLDNDGVLTGDRGVVTRQFGGDCEWLVNEQDTKRIKLTAENDAWEIKLRRVEGQNFELTIIESTSVS